MDSSTISVISGAAIGGGISILTTYMVHVLSAKREKEKYLLELSHTEIRWHRDKLDEAFRNTLKHIIKLRNIGPITNNTNVIDLSNGIPHEWLSDITNARAWLETLFFYCPEIYQDDLGELSCELFNATNLMMGFKINGTWIHNQFGHIIKNRILDYQAFLDWVNSLETELSSIGSRIIRDSLSSLSAPNPSFNSDAASTS